MKKILFLLTSSSPFRADLSIITNVIYLEMVAGSGIEPLTSGL